MEVTFALISMHLELNMVKLEPRGGSIHIAVDSHEHPLNFAITRGSTRQSKLIELVQSTGYLIADKGYDSDNVRQVAGMHKMIPVIPRRANSHNSNRGFDSYLYKLRQLVANAFARLKQFRSIATRFDKLAQHFKSRLYIAGTLIYCNSK